MREIGEIEEIKEIMEIGGIMEIGNMGISTLYPYNRRASVWIPFL